MTIFVQLVGGLGNQMFQYALGRRLSVGRGVPLKLDVTELDNPAIRTPRSYRLCHFNIQAEIATLEEVSYFTSHRLTTRIRRRVCRVFPTICERHTISEGVAYQFSREVIETKKRGDLYLVGYWQNERYFAPIEEIIRKDLNIRAAPDAANLDMAKQIRDTQAISIHIRRGDYASDPVTRAAHGLLPLEYYMKAVQEIAAIVSNPHFYLFSDDPLWTGENLQLKYPTTIIRHNGPDKDYEDLRLMTMCKHHIIANSSFSWWGAWLSGHRQKLVFAPSKWLNQLEIDTSDVTPVTWRRIS